VLFAYEPYDRGKHYQALSQLWVKRGWLVPPADCLPPTGFVARDTNRDEPGAALFIYLVPDCVGWIDWGIADPDLDQASRRYAMRVLFRLCEELAKQRRARFLYSTSQSQAFRSMLLDCGMMVAEERTTTFCKSLAGEAQEDDMAFIRDYEQALPENAAE